MNKNKLKLLNNKKFWLLAGGFTVTAASTALVVACGTMDETSNAASTEDRTGELKFPTTFNKLEETKAQEKIISPNGDSLFQQIHDVVKTNAKDKPMTVAMLAANMPNTFNGYTVPTINLPVENINGLVVGMLLEAIKSVWQIPANTSIISFMRPLEAAGLNVLNVEDLKARIKALTENYDSKGTDATASWADFTAFWEALTSKDDNYSYLRTILARPKVLGDEESVKNLNNALRADPFKSPVDIFNPVATTPGTTTPGTTTPETTTPGTTTPAEPPTPTPTPTPGETTNPTETTTTPAATVITKKSEAEAISNIVTPGTSVVFKGLHQSVKEQPEAEVTIEYLNNKKPNAFTTASLAGLITLPDTNGLVISMLIESIKAVWKLDPATPLLSLATPILSTGLGLQDIGKLSNLTKNYDGQGTDATASWADFAYFWEKMLNATDGYAYLKSVLGRDDVLGAEGLKKLNAGIKDSLKSTVDIFKPVATTPGTSTPGTTTPETTTPGTTTPAENPTPTPTPTPTPGETTNPSEPTTTPAATVITKKSEAEAISNIVTPGTSVVFKGLHQSVKDQPGAQVTTEYLNNKKPNAFTTASLAGLITLPDTNGLVISMLIESIKAVWKLDPATPLFDLAAPILSTGLGLQDIGKLSNLTKNYDGQGTDATASWADFAYFWEKMLNATDGYAYLKSVLGKDDVLGAEGVKKLNAGIKDSLKSTVDIFKPVATTPGTSTPTEEPAPTNNTPIDSSITKKSEAEAISNIVTPGTSVLFKGLHQSVKDQRGAQVTIAYLNGKKPNGFTSAHFGNLFNSETTNGLIISMLIESIKVVWQLAPGTTLLELGSTLLEIGIGLNDLDKFGNITQNYDGQGTDATASWADFAYFWEQMLNPANDYAYLKSVLGSDKVLGIEALKTLSTKIKLWFSSPVDIFKQNTPAPTPTNPSTTTPSGTVIQPEVTDEASAINIILNPGTKVVPKMINATATEQGGETLTQALLEQKKPSAFTSIKALGVTIQGVNGLLVSMLVEGIKHIWQLPAGIPLTSFMPALAAAGLSITDSDKLSSMLVNLTKNYRGENTEATNSWADFLAFWEAMTNPANGYSYLKSVLGNDNVLGLESLKKLNTALANTFNTTFDLFADPTDTTTPVTPPKPVTPTKPIINNVVETNLISRGAVVARRPIDDAKNYIINHDEKDVLMNIFKRILTEFAEGRGMSLEDLLQSDPNSYEQTEFTYVIKLLGPVALITLLEAIWQVPPGSLDQNSIISIFTDVMALDLTSLPGILDNLIKNFDGQGTYALTNWDTLVHFVEIGGNPYNNFESIKRIIARDGVITESQLRRLDAILATPKGRPSPVVTRGGYNYPGLGGKLSIYAGAAEKEITPTDVSESDAIAKIGEFDSNGPVYKAVFMAVYYADKWSNNYTFYDLKLPVYLEWAKGIINWFIEKLDLSDAKRTPTNWLPRHYSQWIIAELMPFVLQHVYGLSDDVREWLQNEDIWKEVFGISRFDFAQRAWTIFSNSRYDSLNIPNANGEWRHLVNFTSWLMSYNLPEKYKKIHDEEYGWKYYKNFTYFMNTILKFGESDSNVARSFAQVDLILSAPKYGNTKIRDANNEIMLGFSDGTKTGVLPFTESQIKERGIDSPWKTDEGRYEYIARWLPYAWGVIDPFDNANNSEIARYYDVLKQLGVDLKAAVKKINFTNYDGNGTDATVSETTFYEFLLKFAGFENKGKITILNTYETYRTFKHEFQIEGAKDYFFKDEDKDKVFKLELDRWTSWVDFIQTRRTLWEMFTKEQRQRFNIILRTPKDQSVQFTWYDPDGTEHVVLAQGFGAYDVLWPFEDSDNQ